MSGRYEKDMAFENKTKLKLQNEPAILTEYYYSLTEDEKKQLSMFNIISKDIGLQKTYCDIFNFFFEENIKYDSKNNVYSYETGCRTWIFVDNAPLIYRSWVKKYREYLKRYLIDNYENPLKF